MQKCLSEEQEGTRDEGVGTEGKGFGIRESASARRVSEYYEQEIGKWVTGYS